MIGKIIKVNEFEIPSHTGEPFTTVGVLSGKELNGIHLDFKASSSVVDEMDKLFKARIVTVEDPFIDRSYQAQIQLESTSYQAGVPNKRYVGSVQEVDKVDDFEFLEIEGTQYKVLKYKEVLDLDNEIRREALLRMSREEYLEFRTLMVNHEGHFNVRRIGIDSDPLQLDVINRLLWSKHENEEQVYYKQLLVLGTPTAGQKQNPFSRVMTVVDNAGLIAVATQGRFEALLNDLVQAGIVTKERRDELLNKPLNELLDEARTVDIRALRTETDDVEEEWYEE